MARFGPSLVLVSESLSYFSLALYLIGICSFVPIWVFIVLGGEVFGYVGEFRMESEWNMIEFLWTFLPSLAVVVLCWMNVISCVGHYVVQDGIPVKVIGHQWYWSYGDGESEYDSFMTDLISSVDRPLRLVSDSYYLLYVGSADVIHSFSVPDLSIKMDAVPGRINRVGIYTGRFGSFVGYCSELCGAGHSYMPIVVEVLKR